MTVSLETARKLKEAGWPQEFGWTLNRFRNISDSEGGKRFYETFTDDAEAEDAVQQTYVTAFAKLADFRGEASLATWLTRIAINEALGRRRRERPTVDPSALDGEGSLGSQIIPFPLMPMPADPERDAARHQIRQILERAIDELPDAFRSVFVMHEIEDMSVEETADFLGVQPATVKTRLHRARRLLRQALDAKLASALTDTFHFDGARCRHTTDAVLARLGPLRAPGT